MRIESLEEKLIAFIQDKKRGNNPNVWGLIALCIVINLGFLEYYLDNSFRLTLIYLALICVVTLKSGKIYGYILSIVSSVASEKVFFSASRHNLFTVLTCVNILATSLLFMLFVLLVHRLRTYRINEEKTARTDNLTGLLNAKALGEILAKEIERCRRFKHPFCVAHLACNNFQQVREKIGQAQADGILRLVGECMHATLRGTDFVARAYDDEFVALLTETDEQAARLAMEKLTSRLREVITQHYQDLSFPIGVVCFTKCPYTYQEALDMTDMALYEARRLDKIVIFTK